MTQPRTRQHTQVIQFRIPIDLSNIGVLNLEMTGKYKYTSIGIANGSRSGQVPISSVRGYGGFGVVNDGKGLIFIIQIGHQFHSLQAAGHIRGSGIG